MHFLLEIMIDRLLYSRSLVARAIFSSYACILVRSSELVIHTCDVNYR